MQDKVTWVLGVVGTLLTLATSYLGIQQTLTREELDAVRQQLDREIANRREERSWAEKIFEKYDRIVSEKEAEAQSRIDRLNGLLTLTILVSKDEPELRQQLITLIKEQVDRYRAMLKELEKATPEAQKAGVTKEIELIDQFSDSLSSRIRLPDPAPEPEEEGGGGGGRPAPAVPAVPAVRWTNYDFDIFWCESSGEAAERIAERMLQLRAEDPAATGRWRKRTLTTAKNAEPGYGISGYLIRVSQPDERPLAEAFQQLGLIKVLPHLTTKTFPVQTVSFPTPWYISVFVCPAPERTAP